jgi:ribonuclease HI
MYTLQFDGGATPNPGKGAGAFVLYQDGNVLAEGGIFFKHCTNNIGEYNGLLLGLKRCKELGVSDITIQGDSLLVINQITGKWKIRHPHLQPLHQEIMSLLTNMKTDIQHVPRNQNSYADSLSDKTISLESDWMKK